jgi:hypothetical protein
VQRRGAVAAAGVAAAGVVAAPEQHRAARHGGGGWPSLNSCLSSRPAISTSSSSFSSAPKPLQTQQVPAGHSCWGRCGALALAPLEPWLPSSRWEWTGVEVCCKSLQKGREGGCMKCRPTCVHNNMA